MIRQYLVHSYARTSNMFSELILCPTKFYPYPPIKFHPIKFFFFLNIKITNHSIPLESLAYIRNYTLNVDNS